MADNLYYYSLDGQKPIGPVNTDTIRQLADRGVLGEGSYICPVGGAAWQPWDAATASRLGIVAEPPAKKGKVAPSKSAKPAKKVKPRPARKDDKAGEKGFIPLLLNIVALLAALRALLIWMKAPPQLPQEVTDKAGILGVLGAGVLVLVVLPWMIASIFFRGFLRVFMRTAALVGASLWMAHLHPGIFTLDATLETQVKESVQTFRAQLQRQLDSKGHAGGDDALVQDQLDQLSAKAVGDSDEARSARATITVLKEMQAKEKAIRAIVDNAARLRANITGQGDLPPYRSALVQIHLAAADFISCIDDFPNRLRTAMQQESVSPVALDHEVEEASQSIQASQTRAIWEAVIKFADDEVGEVDCLASNVGQWSVNNGKFVFTSQAAMDQFKQQVQTTAVDRAALEALMRQSAQTLLDLPDSD